MTLDEILSQVAGGFNLQALSLDNILRAVLVLAVGVVVIKLIQRAVERILSRNAALAPIHRYLRSALSVVLWLLLALVLLGSMGVELTSIIALLSVAGLAVSLALQNTLSNLAGGIMLLVSKPFTIGDYVEIGAVSGTVSMIGMSYSTLTTVENKEIYIPNSQLSSATIINPDHRGEQGDLHPQQPALLRHHHQLHPLGQAAHGDHRQRLLPGQVGGCKGRPGRRREPVPRHLPGPRPGDPPERIRGQRSQLPDPGLDHHRGLLGHLLQTFGGHPPRLPAPRGVHALSSNGCAPDPRPLGKIHLTNRRSFVKM